MTYQKKDTIVKMIRKLSILLWGLALLTGGCSTITPAPPESSKQGLYLLTATADTMLEKHAPIFLIEENQNNYNRIGTPAVKDVEPENHDIFIDTGQATIYAMTQDFETSKGKYTNLIYRVHFPKTPFPHLTAGKNVGLFVYITLNSEQETVLITTLHTCGCFLAFIPTAKLPEKSWPADWAKKGQIVYGEELPGLLDNESNKQKLIINLRGATHRVINARYANTDIYDNIESFTMQIKPMLALEHLPTADKRTVSFFINKGARKGMVKGSKKPLEMLFMSLLAMDPFIGEDKALGSPEETGTTIYTSLKFWDRRESNIWFFPRFLKYWGWDL